MKLRCFCPFSFKKIYNRITQNRQSEINSNNNKNLNKIDWDSVNSDVEELSFKNQLIECKVVSVYDGDTIKCVFPLNGKLYKWNCSINGIDTEIRTKSTIEKELGYKAKFSQRKILNKNVMIYCNDFDKYGRLLVNVKIDKIDIKNLMIQNKFAVEYYGKTKINWDEFLNNK